MSSWGSIENIRDLLDVEEGTQTAKILRLKKLSNIWLNAFAHSDIISDVSTDVKNTATEYHTVYLFRLSSDRFSGDITEFATRWKDEGKELLDREILADSEVYIATKVNK